MQPILMQSQPEEVDVSVFIVRRVELFSHIADIGFGLHFIDKITRDHFAIDAPGHNLPQFRHSRVKRISYSSPLEVAITTNAWWVWVLFVVMNYDDLKKGALSISRDIALGMTTLNQLSNEELERFVSLGKRIAAHILDIGAQGGDAFAKKCRLFKSRLLGGKGTITVQMKKNK